MQFDVANCAKVQKTRYVDYVWIILVNMQMHFSYKAYYHNRYRDNLIYMYL